MNTFKKWIKPAAVAVLLLPISVSADEIIPKVKSQKWSIGINYMPNVSFRKLVTDITDPNALRLRSIFAMNEKSDKIKHGFSAGIDINYDLSNRIRIQSGVNYNNRGYLAKYSSEDLSRETDLKIRYAYHYIDIPLNADITLIKKKSISLFTRFGGSMGLNIGSRTVAIEQIPNGIGKAKYIYPGFEASSTLFSVLGGIGINKALNNKMNIQITPTYRRAVTNYIEAPITAKLWDIGINMSLIKNIRFKEKNKSKRN